MPEIFFFTSIDIDKNFDLEEVRIQNTSDRSAKNDKYFV